MFLLAARAPIWLGGGRADVLVMRAWKHVDFPCNDVAKTWEVKSSKI